MAKKYLDGLIEKYKVQPVGCGYIDCIVTFDNVFGFINDLSNANIKITGLTWWCYCKKNGFGCPHGMGGPLSRYYEGWFSETVWPIIEFENNEQVAAYIKNPGDSEISECFVPALWLDVPADWKNLYSEVSEKDSSLCS